MLAQCMIKKQLYERHFTGQNDNLGCFGKFCYLGDTFGPSGGAVRTRTKIGFCCAQCSSIGNTCVCKDLTSSWRRPCGLPRNTWIKGLQHMLEWYPSLSEKWDAALRCGHRFMAQCLLPDMCLCLLDKFCVFSLLLTTWGASLKLKGTIYKACVQSMCWYMVVRLGQ